MNFWGNPFHIFRPGSHWSDKHSDIGSSCRMTCENQCFPMGAVLTGLTQVGPTLKMLPVLLWSDFDPTSAHWISLKSDQSRILVLTIRHLTSDVITAAVKGIYLTLGLFWLVKEQVRLSQSRIKVVSCSWGWVHTSTLLSSYFALRHQSYVHPTLVLYSSDLTEYYFNPTLW